MMAGSLKLGIVDARMALDRDPAAGSGEIDGHVRISRTPLPAARDRVARRGGPPATTQVRSIRITLVFFHGIGTPLRG